MKRQKPKGRSAKYGRKPSPYTKYNKRPYSYKDDQRLANGELRRKANDSPRNKYYVD